MSTQTRGARAPVVAIDGPSGAGKGTVARALARALGYRHVDTGAMYRAVGWKARQRGLAPDDEAGIGRVAETASIEIDEARVIVDGDDVTRAIRTPEIDRAAAAVARMPRVRTALVARQRALGEGGAIVMEGRDIGTVVFPDADVKVYLDASAEERARRRAADPAHAGPSRALGDVATALVDRDRSDATRTVSPLVAAPDAIYVDTTGVDIQAVVDRVLAIVRERLAPRLS